VLDAAAAVCVVLPSPVPGAAGSGAGRNRYLLRLGFILLGGIRARLAPCRKPPQTQLRREWSHEPRDGVN
jgi:hypothetical protein